MGTVYTIPRLTVSLTLPLSSSSLSVSADSRDVAAVSRPNARWDMKRSETSSASVCMTVGITTFMYMLPSYDRIEASAKKQQTTIFTFRSHASSNVATDAICCVALPSLNSFGYETKTCK